jgi:glycine/sarcosine N-methyltransferase
MYNSFSSDYDRFVNWKSRLAMELPFLEEKINQAFPLRTSSLRILDAATGTGMHAIALSKKGFKVTGTDLSEGMIERARENATLEKCESRFEVAGFGNLAKTFGIQQSGKKTIDPESDNLKFDSVLCLGNSLPHVTSQPELQAALQDFANCLVKNGLLILQNRNFDAVMAARERWMEPQFHKEKDKEWLFMRFYDYRPDKLIDFNIVTLFREGQSDWTQTVSQTVLQPLLSVNLLNELEKVGFQEILTFGDMTGKPYNSASSGNLVVTARKK